MSTLLALDISTMLTGVAVLRLSETTNVVEVLAAAALAGSSQRARLAVQGPVLRGARNMEMRCQRIRSTAHGLSAWVGSLPVALDGVAYEAAWGTGEAAEALHQTAGVCLCLSCLAGLPKYKVAVAQAKAVFGGNGLARDEAKAGAIRWCLDRYPALGLAGWSGGTDGEQAAVADAITVGVAGFKLIAAKPPVRKRKRNNGDLCTKNRGE